jgi:hypothetical protein
MAEIEAICATADPIVRNLRIPQACAEMSAALAARAAPGANWCTFATWASKQAGHTIRLEDLARFVEGHLGRPNTLTPVIERLTPLFRAIGRAADRHLISGAIHEAASPVAALTRASAAATPPRGRASGRSDQSWWKRPSSTRFRTAPIWRSVYSPSSLPHRSGPSLSRISAVVCGTADITRTTAST